MYLDANGKEYGAIVSAHNDWMKAMSTFSTGQMVISSEKGISALSVCDITLVQGVVLPQPTASPTVNSVPVKVLSRLDSKTRLEKGVTYRVGKSTSSKVRGFRTVPTDPSNYMNTTLMKRYTSNLPQLVAAWKYKAQIVCPAFAVILDVSGGSTGLYQAQQSEPWSMPVSNVPQVFLAENLQDSYLTLTQKHEAAAQMDLRTGGSAVESEVERDINSLGDKGRGGFFCHLAGELAGALGWQGGKDIAETVGAFTGL